MADLLSLELNVFVCVCVGGGGVKQGRTKVCLVKDKTRHIVRNAKQLFYSK